MKKDFSKRLKKIKALVLDVDGILTNGDIVLDKNGDEIKIFNVQDGFGLVLLKKLGFHTAIISARSTHAVAARAQDLKIDKVYQNAYPKMDAYRQLLTELSLKDEEVCFMGDDLPDIAVLKAVGFSVTVPNGVPEVKKIAHYTTKNEGGCGAIREIIEMILKAQGKWALVCQQFA